MCYGLNFECLKDPSKIVKVKGEKVTDVLYSFESPSGDVSLAQSVTCTTTCCSVLPLVRGHMRTHS